MDKVCVCDADHSLLRLGPVRTEATKGYYESACIYESRIYSTMDAGAGGFLLFQGEEMVLLLVIMVFFFFLYVSPSSCAGHNVRCVFRHLADDERRTDVM